MNKFNVTKRILAIGLMASTLSLVGCKADGDGSNFPGGGVGGGGNGVTDTRNCQVPLGTTLCVLGGDNHDGGLVDVLLATDGPLGPIAGAIDTNELTTALSELLENDETLASLVTGLLEDGQLEEGLTLLLQGEGGDGNGALGALIGSVLNQEEGEGLKGLFGENGIQGLVNALLVDGTDSSCQAPLGTLCLIAGNGSNQEGLVDLLLTTDGALGALSSTATGNLTDEVVEVLGNILEGDGSLPVLVEGLFADGHLAAGLNQLLGGVDDEPGLLELLTNTVSGLGPTVEDILDYLGGLLGTT